MNPLHNKKNRECGNYVPELIEELEKEDGAMVQLSQQEEGVEMVEVMSWHYKQSSDIAQDSRSGEYKRLQRADGRSVRETGSEHSAGQQQGPYLRQWDQF